MSWIKDNPFVAVLGGVTLVGAGALIFVGQHFKGSYDASYATFSEDSSVVSSAEKFKPYPTKENRDGKTKAIADYKADIAKLQKAFEPYQPAALTAISPQEFTGNIKTSSDKIHEAFAATNAKLPDQFFVGFEAYRSALARETATAVLNDELGAFTEIFLSLAKAGPKELLNVHRPELAEESGGTFDDKDASYRALPLEITFHGSEKSLRGFVSALAASTNYYNVIRVIRIANDKPVGPVPSDAKFEAADAAEATAATPFAGFATPAADGTVAPAPEAATGPADTSKILQQVLGDEDLTVFIRLDVVRFLPAKDITKL